MAAAIAKADEKYMPTTRPVSHALDLDSISLAPSVSPPPKLVGLFVGSGVGGVGEFVGFVVIVGVEVNVGAEVTGPAPR
eukprot:CAMPEP_0170169168 /NCGR_PEP_ID=MMETSP0040_2-20121228/2108_1 /TAXON_ID=641309 /ORGANISM="Lotharella oceanica, Strain CCMP622" /LENGTH=78 /DNA_ID=CAMNT_0010407769 /DNA_START=319 /DNA_END=555 /DNA_ORIENTATION=+